MNIYIEGYPVNPFLRYPFQRINLIHCSNVWKTAIPFEIDQYPKINISKIVKTSTFTKNKKTNCVIMCNTG